MALTKDLFMAKDTFHQKMKELIYPLGTKPLNDYNSIAL